ncbi:unnamed protein product, partial [Prunus brigantina]
MKGDPSKRDISKYCAFHGEHGHYTNNCNPWKRHLEELVRESHCTKFVAKKAIQQIEDLHVDEGRATSIPQLSVIQQMGLDPKISKLARSLTDFNGATSITVGTIDLDVHSPLVVCLQTFMVIDEVSSYNGILGQPWINKIEAITSALHQKIRYPIPGAGSGKSTVTKPWKGDAQPKGSRRASSCSSHYTQANPKGKGGIRPEDSPEKGWKPVDDVVEEGWKLEKDVELVPLNPDQPDKEAQIGSPKNPNKKDREEGIHPEGSLEEGWKPEEDVDLVPLDPDQPNKEARIGSRLSPDEKMEMTIFLQNNKDMFAWSPSDMPGIDPNIVCHRLRVNHASKPVVQKRRNFAFGMAGQHCSGIETRKGKIDQLVDSTSGNQLLSFMDAYSGYNQIMMYDDDKVKTSFIIERGTYYYKVMPFGLKNAGATYHRLVNKIFTDQIGRTMEVYEDDMLVKAPKRADHLKNLTEAFSLLRQYRMKLNPSKCTFGVSS